MRASTIYALGAALAALLAGALGLAGCDESPPFSGRVWEDRDADGVIDAAEPGVPGVKVNLYCGTALRFSTLDDAVLAVCGSATTDENGEYRLEFPDFVESLIRAQLEFVTPAGFAFTRPGASVDPATGRSEDRVFEGDESFIIDAGLVAVTESGGAPQPTETEPEPAATASIGERYWYDENDDGIQQPQEFEGERLGGDVVLFDDSGVEVARTSIDNGVYQLTGLAPGTYRVQFPLPANGNFTFTAPDAGGDDSLDSDVDATGMATVTLAAGEQTTSIDAGIRFTG